MKHLTNERRRILTGVAFILPNLIGFAAFTLIPLAVSLYLAFTDWDITRHNIFKDESISFIGIKNFVHLFQHPYFWQFLYNTLFLMMIIPFSIAASLCAALLLNEKFSMGKKALRMFAILAIPISALPLLLAALGWIPSNLAWILVGTILFLFLGGLFAGPSFYRTMYYLPHFTAGVATFLLWKKMYDPQSGPLNAMLQPVLDIVSTVGAQLSGPAGVVIQICLWAGGIFLAVFGLRAVCRAWLEESGLRYIPKSRKWRASLIRLVLFGIPVAILAIAALSWRQWVTACAAGLDAPDWLGDYHWAKPALMIMILWISAGSTNMLLYFAALTTVPGELYEAADIDGASRVQRFWNVTWPQLAPITFFIAIMSVIGGLQGGFEMARTMTNGGPGGATTTLSYFVYIEGFQTGRLGLASAIAWCLFVLVFVVTLFNWRFGSRMTNE